MEKSQKSIVRNGKADKLHVMVAFAEKPRMGRPRKFSGEPVKCQLLVPPDLYAAAERIRADRKLADFPDAIRELMRLGAESRGLVEPRK